MAAIIKIRYAVHFALACENAGYDPTKLLHSVDISDRLLQQPEEMVSEHQLWTLVGAAAKATGKFDIGRDAARISSLEDHGELQRIFQEKTLFERLLTFCELAQLEYSRADFFVQQRWNGLVFGRKAIVGDREQIRQVELYALELMQATIQSVLGFGWTPKALNLQSDQEDHLEAIIGSADTKLKLGQPETEVLLNHGEMEMGSVQTVLPSAINQDKLSHTVTPLVRTYLFDPRLSLSFVSRLLGLSERHLQRDLHKEGTSFSQILRRVRTHVASELLRASDISMSEISRSIGYSNQAHFTRAFLRSTGITPTQFRKSNDTR